MASIYHYGTVQRWNTPTGEQHVANHLYYITKSHAYLFMF